MKIAICPWSLADGWPEPVEDGFGTWDAAGKVIQAHGGVPARRNSTVPPERAACNDTHGPLYCVTC